MAVVSRRRWRRAEEEEDGVCQQRWRRVEEEEGETDEFG